MDKSQWDHYYHELRKLSLTDDLIQKEAIVGITTHLTKPGGDYQGLLRFLAYYGELFILPDVIAFLEFNRTLKFNRVVELGAGFGWLGRGLSTNFNIPAVYVDKRQFTSIDIVADIESVNGRQRVLDILKDGDLIVMSEVLHCLNEPADVMSSFAKWPKLVIEYQPVNQDFKKSYEEQIRKLGCTVFPGIRQVFPDHWISHSTANYTHGIWIVKPRHFGQSLGIPWKQDAQ